MKNLLVVLNLLSSISLIFAEGFGCLNLMFFYLDFMLLDLFANFNKLFLWWFWFLCLIWWFCIVCFLLLCGVCFCIFSFIDLIFCLLFSLFIWYFIIRLIILLFLLGLWLNFLLNPIINCSDLSFIDCKVHITFF